MNIYLIGFVLVVAILLTLLFYLIMNTKDNSKSQKNSYKTPSNNNSKIDVEELSFPKNIENMNGVVLNKACKVIIDSYKALDYANKLPSSMDKIEWHTWQVSILLFALKTNAVNLVFDLNTIFHQSILETPEEQKEQDKQRILRKYRDRASIEKSRDELSRDVIWTARDVSIILLELLKR